MSATAGFELGGLSICRARQRESGHEGFEPPSPGAGIQARGVCTTRRSPYFDSIRLFKIKLVQILARISRWNQKFIQKGGLKRIVQVLNELVEMGTKYVHHLLAMCKDFVLVRETFDPLECHCRLFFLIIMQETKNPHWTLRH
jgi:hypothetical protein